MHDTRNRRRTSPIRRATLVTRFRSSRGTGTHAIVALAGSLLVAATLAGCGAGGDGGDGGGAGGGTTEPDRAPTTGAVAVTTTTSGAEVDADGYTVAIDGGSAQTIASAGSLVLASLKAGTHVVELGGVAANCTVDGGATQTASVTAGDTTAVAFAVTCVAVTGALTVTTTTDDAAIDPNGYEVILADTTTVLGGVNYSIRGDSTVARVGTNGSTTATGLQPGNYVILLGGRRDGCGVANGPPRVIPIVAGDTTSVNYDINCGSPKFFGNIEIRTNTTGFNIDADGYAFSISFDEEQPIGTRDDVTIPRSIGPRSAIVWLRGVAANCTVDGGNVQVADVLEGPTTTVVFNVTCGSDP